MHFPNPASTCTVVTACMLEIPLMTSDGL